LGFISCARHISFFEGAENLENKNIQKQTQTYTFTDKQKHSQTYYTQIQRKKSLCICGVDIFLCSKTAEEMDSQTFKFSYPTSMKV
jgi:hypothetical protein